MRSAWDLVVHVNDTMPAWLSVVVLAWLISVALTQLVKAAPLHIPDDRRNLLLRAIAAFSAVVTCWALWADTGLSPRLGFIAGLVVGLWSPLSWAILTRVIGTRWPHLRDALAADSSRTKE